jgi:hypothetical protein
MAGDDEMRRTWTSTFHEALTGADRLVIHTVVEIPVEQLFKDDRDQAYAGIGPGGAFEKVPVFCIADAKKIADLLARIHIDDANSGGGCMCAGWPWFRFFRSGEEIASFTGQHGLALCWQDGPWPGDGALTEETIAAIPAWFLAEGFPELHRAREAEIARQQRAMDEHERFLADLPPEIRAELQE